ncbi:MAG: DUF2934 domain-containing protein [Rhodospirillales bacterium]|nr:DUF2934 domain-containing protein [Rhodospirillales bacterium]
MTNEREARIRERAYQLWEADGRPAGRAVEHWVRAEAEMGGGEAETSDSAATATNKPRRRTSAKPDSPPSGPRRRKSP